MLEQAESDLKVMKVKDILHQMVQNEKKIDSYAWSITMSNASLSFLLFLFVLK